MTIPIRTAGYTITKAEAVEIPEEYQEMYRQGLLGPRAGDEVAVWVRGTMRGLTGIVDYAPTKESDHLGDTIQPRRQYP